MLYDLFKYVVIYDFLERVREEGERLLRENDLVLKF